MRIEDRVREAMRERARAVRSAPDRWAEIEEGASPQPPPRRQPSGRRAVAAAVAFAVFAASAILVWAAFRPADTQTAGDDGAANYVLEDVRVDGPFAYRQEGGVIGEGYVDVGFVVTWGGDVFPGVHSCTWTVYDAEGSVIGRATDEVVALSPSNVRTTQRVEVREEPVTAEAACAPDRIDTVLSYDVADARVLSLLGSTATVRWDVRWPDMMVEGDWPSPNDCTVTVLDPSGEPVASITSGVVPGTTLPTTFDTDIPLGDAAADLSQADRDALTASVACVPFTGERAVVTSPPPQEGSVNAEGLCGGEPATIVAEPGAVEITGTPGNDRVVLPEGVVYRSGGGVDLLCRPDGTVEATVVPEDITVSVYNISDEPGLAAALADQLDSQGFEVADVGVGPRLASQSSVAYYSTPEARAVAEYIASLMTNAVVEVAPPDWGVSDRSSEVVVLVVGAAGS